MKNSYPDWRTEPKVADAPARVDRDWLVLAAMLIGLTLEAILRDDITWQLFGLMFGCVIAAATLWRRTDPLATVALSFGGVALIDIAAKAVGEPPMEIYSYVAILLFAYALTRWASGRHIALGLPIVALPWLVTTVLHYTDLGDAIGGLVVLQLPAVLGGMVRLQRSSTEQRVEQIKANERAEIARELHDTVAHHVSAIAIQAQAGRVMAAASRLDGASEALAIIEEEASRTLSEMRSMITVLRDGGSGSTGAETQRSIADIERFAQPAAHDRPGVVVETSGDLSELGPSVEAALYRLAQESITNAIRHARAAKLVTVELTGNVDDVHLTVVDDGQASAASGQAGGFGLIGMSERAALLGGEITAGPAPTGGWAVHARLPRRRARS